VRSSKHVAGIAVSVTLKIDQYRLLLGETHGSSSLRYEKDKNFPSSVDRRLKGAVSTAAKNQGQCDMFFDIT
jgi:hypothetical protein